MSASSRSRPKRKLEPISIEELAGTTGMSGFCSFLTRDTSIPVPVLDQLDSGAPGPAAPQSPAPVPTTAIPCAPDRYALDSRYGAAEPISSAPEPEESSAPDTAAPGPRRPETVAPESLAAVSGAPDSRYPRRPRIREAITVQDGHSLAEQAVYDAMWRVGKPHDDDARILTIGLRTLAELSHMAYSNCKANVRSLVAKRALDEFPGFSYTDGRTYIIHGEREILRRRKAAGLTHVLRTRGVAFVDPQSGAPKIGALETSNDIVIITDALRRYFPDVTEAEAAALWERCREAVPDATSGKVARAIDLKVGKPGLPMPFSFLLTAVPKSLQQRPENDPAVRDRLFAAEILKNLDADEEQREWARSVLDPATR